MTNHWDDKKNNDKYHTAILVIKDEWTATIIYNVKYHRFWCCNESLETGKTRNAYIMSLTKCIPKKIPAWRPVCLQGQTQFHC